MKFAVDTINGHCGERVSLKLWNGNTVMPIRAKQCIMFGSMDLHSARVIDIENEGDYGVISVRASEDGDQLLSILALKSGLILYRDPETDETATLNVIVIPAHQHRDHLAGPAVGSYDAFQAD